MSEIVNLRLHRKRKRRAGQDDAATANRLAHGQPKSVTMKEERIRALQKKRLDMHRRAPKGEGDG
jgi:hypothetical protein